MEEGFYFKVNSVFVKKLLPLNIFLNALADVPCIRFCSSPVDGEHKFADSFPKFFSESTDTSTRPQKPSINILINSATAVFLEGDCIVYGEDISLYIFFVSLLNKKVVTRHS